MVIGLTAISGEDEDDWVEDFLPLNEKAVLLVNKVGKFVRSEDENAAVLALKEAVEKLPSILGEIKAIPNPEEKELREINKKFQKGFQEFIDMCKYGVIYYDKPTRWNQNVWMTMAESAAEKLKEANVRLSQYLND